jgi:hypothetical protein
MMIRKWKGTEEKQAEEEGKTECGMDKKRIDR